MRLSVLVLLAVIAVKAAPAEDVKETVPPPPENPANERDIAKSKQPEKKDMSKHAAHMQPIGHGREMTPTAVVEGWPADADFTKHLEGETPFVAKGGANIFAAAQKWTKSFFDGLEMFVTYSQPHVPNANKDKDIAKTSTILRFKDAIKKVESDKGSAVTLLYHGLLEDLSMPPPLKCIDHVQKVELSVTASNNPHHNYENDEMDTFYCLLSGSQDLILINSSHTLDHGSMNDGSDVDLNKVDLNVFPGLADAPYSQIALSAGDCVYIPMNWHSFQKPKAGSSDVTTAVNFLFDHHDIEAAGNNAKHCAHVEKQPLAQRLSSVDEVVNLFGKFEDCLFHAPPHYGEDEGSKESDKELEDPKPRKEVTLDEAAKCVNFLFGDNLTATEAASFTTLDTNKDNKVSEEEWNKATGNEKENIEKNATDTVLLELSDVSEFFYGLRDRAVDLLTDHDDERDPREEGLTGEESGEFDNDAEDLERDGDDMERDGEGGEGDEHDDDLMDEEGATDEEEAKGDKKNAGRHAEL